MPVAPAVVDALDAQPAMPHVCLQHLRLRKSEKIAMKSLAKRIIRNFGFDVRRYRPACSESAQLQAMLSSHGVNLVFDVGANAGQFGRYLRNAGYKGRIASFEPMSAARGLLLETSKSDPLWEVAAQAAIGSEDGEIKLNIAGNSVSSSVLRMLDTHARAAPGSSYSGSEMVPLRRLDSLAQDYLLTDSVPFLKIDAQGYEDRVLGGAANTLRKVIGLQLELSLIPLYEGQVLYDDLVPRLRSLGFELWDMTPVFVDKATGRLLQIDATLFRVSKS